jgi:DNA topoisomerase-1
MIKKYLTNDQYKLYKLIWDRFTASQMQSATLSTVAVDFANNGYLFRTSGYSITFPGYMAVYEESEEEQKKNVDDLEDVKDIRLPELSQGQQLGMKKISPDKHFTEPPARYTEASLIKFLEEKGIGRPSTYAPIITTIISRNYVLRDGKVFMPTHLGVMTTKLMKESFADIVDCKFTARMEEMLDSIERGESDAETVLGEFWKGFETELLEAEAKIGDMDLGNSVEETDIICEKCGSKMVIKNGKFGKFAACPNFPKCKNTKSLTETKPEETVEKEKEKESDDTVPGMKCEKCGAGMVVKNGRYGAFYACSNYPKCKFTKPKNKEIDIPCPKCGSKIVVKYSKAKNVFYCCEKYPKCDFSSWDMPLSEKCPQCGKNLFKKKGKSMAICHDKACGYEIEMAFEATDKESEN